DRNVTGVQTCALPILRMGRAQFILSASLMIGALLGESPFAFAQEKPAPAANVAPQASEKNSMIVTSDYYIGPEDILEIIVWRNEIGRASCRERGEVIV